MQVYREPELDFGRHSEVVSLKSAQPNVRGEVLENKENGKLSLSKRLIQFVNASEMPVASSSFCDIGFFECSLTTRRRHGCRTFAPTRRMRAREEISDEHACGFSRRDPFILAKVHFRGAER
jgi:hypothetical protein